MRILILAAGKSSRFINSQKVLTNFAGTPVIEIILNQCLKVAETDIITNSANFKHITHKNQHKTKYKNKYIQSQEGYGTGYAVIDYLKQSQYKGDLVIVPGDIPLIDDSQLQLVMQKHADIVIGEIACCEDGYGRIIKDTSGKITKIAEYKDYQDISETVNTGIMKISANTLDILYELSKNAHNEIFLTDIIEIAYKKKIHIESVLLDQEKSQGFNTIQQFNRLLKLSQTIWRNKALQQGAIFHDIDSVYLNYDTIIEQGAIIEPMCFFGPNVKIGGQAIIKSYSYLNNCHVKGEVGPFAHIKSGTMEEDSILGAFVEMKNSQIGKKTKIKHLSYIGDATIEDNINIGAGCVICNYDGKNKHQTIIKSNAFIGSNTSLIAPITIGENAFIAAGGVYNQDVEDNMFAIERSKMIKKENKKKDSVLF